MTLLKLILKTNMNKLKPNFININKYKQATVATQYLLYSSKPEVLQFSDSDSDSEREFNHRIERGKSEFWRRKMRTFHRILDINKDGVVSFDDFKILVDRFVYLGHLSPQQEKEFNEVVKSMWEERWGTISPYNLVTTEQYLEDMHHIVNDKDLRKKVHTFLPFLFKAVDKDKNGYITEEEFKLFFNCLGLSPDIALVSFSSVDEDLDGRITLKEFVKTGRDFFLTEDQRKPSKLFWGPLVK
ncbi:hypothetical protein O3M35_003759 [Rhynocoris fuscipes]|uniref:EF-hand domain-containing protein n=1 Tax=Rhynocoris fuscipes TaxID=488301 RepID=A0AAW1CNK8_9HEMI